MRNKLVFFICLALVTLSFTACVPKSSTNQPTIATTQPLLIQYGTDIKSLQDNVAALKSAVTILQSAPTSPVTKAEIDAMKAATTTLETKLTLLSNQVGVSQTASPSLTGLAKQTDIDILTTKVGGITANVTDIQAQITLIKDAAKALNDAVTAAQNLDNSKNATQDTNLATLQTALTNLTLRVTALEANSASTLKPAIHINGINAVAITVLVDAGGVYPIVLNAYGVDNGGDFNVSTLGGTVTYASIMQDERTIYTSLLHSGTAKATNGSTVITGFSTAWPIFDAGGANSIYYFKIGSDINYYQVFSFDTPTQVTLSSTYTGTTKNTSYTIYSLDNSPNRTATIVITAPIGTGWVAGNLIQVSVQGMNVQYATAMVGA